MLNNGDVHFSFVLVCSLFVSCLLLLLLLFFVLFCFGLFVCLFVCFFFGGGVAGRCYRVGLMLIMSLLACCAVFTNEKFVCKLFYNINFYHPFR